MADWKSASIMFVTGFTGVFAVLALLMYSMRLIGAILSKMGSKKTEEKN